MSDLLEEPNNDDAFEFKTEPNNNETVKFKPELNYDEAVEFKTVQKEWWLQLYNELQCNTYSLSINSLMCNLGVRQEYDLFCARYFTVFWELAIRVPAYCSRHMCLLDNNYLLKTLYNPRAVQRKEWATPNFQDQMLCVKTYGPYSCVGLTGKVAIVTCFIEVWSVVETMNFSIFGSDSSCCCPKAQYCLANYQGELAEDWCQNIDMAFHYTTHASLSPYSVHLAVKFVSSKSLERPNETDIGQMAEYAQLVWKAQPTRAFVPVLFIDNTYMSLLLFSRDELAMVGLGRLCHFSMYPTPAGIFSVCAVVRCLCFILALSSHIFGHTCNVND